MFQIESRMPDIFERLEAENETYTAAERQIALFLLNNRDLIPFETAASIANRLGVSAVTVGRFCRMLGFQHFRDLKEQLRGSANLPWLQGNEFQEFLSDFSDSDKAILAQADGMIALAREAMRTQQIHQALNAVWAVVAEANRYFAGEAPWALAKTDPARQKTVLYVTAEVVRQIAILAQPAMPQACAKMLDILGVPESERDFAALATRIKPAVLRMVGLEQGCHGTNPVRACDIRRAHLANSTDGR